MEPGGSRNIESELFVFVVLEESTIKLPSLNSIIFDSFSPIL